MSDELEEMDSADEVRRHIIASRRIQGRTYRAIADELGVPISLVRREAGPALDAICETALAEAIQARHIEAARLDAAQASIWKLVEGGDLDSIDRFLKISARRCQLLGLDAPQKHEVSGEVKHVVQTIKDRLVMAAAEILTPDQIEMLLIRLDNPRELDVQPVAFDVTRMVEMEKKEQP